MFLYLFGVLFFECGSLPLNNWRFTRYDLNYGHGLWLNGCVCESLISLMVTVFVMFWFFGYGLVFSACSPYVRCHVWLKRMLISILVLFV